MNGLPLLAALIALAPPPEILESPDGARQPGLLVEDAAHGFAFRAEPGGAVPLAEGMAIRTAASPEVPTGVAPPFHVFLGSDQRLSGRLLGFDAETIRLEVRPGAPPIAIARAGALALAQRTGESLILDEDFEEFPPRGWQVVGDVTSTDRTPARGQHSIRLSGTDATLDRPFPKPLDSGRVEFAFRDEGPSGSNATWSAQFAFQRGGSNRITISSIMGWDNEFLAVRSSGEGNVPALAVQRLARKPGWHRFMVRFGPDGISLSVDGDELARTREWPGALASITFNCRIKGNNAELGAYVDDFRIVRLAEPSGPGEIDPTQDVADLVTGDQWFGTIANGDATRFTINTADRPHHLTWDQVARINFRRAISPGKPLEGLWVRASWRVDNGPSEGDRIEGILRHITDDVLAIETPYAGTIEVPRPMLTRLVISDRAWRWVLDDRPRHLGDEPRPSLDPPNPDGGSLEIPFDLPDPHPTSLRLACEVLEVAGEARGLRYSTLVRDGLRSNIRINGNFVDYLNRFIETENMTPEMIRLPLTDDLLKPGRNILRIEQSGTPKQPESLDEVGFLRIQLERPSGPTPPPMP